MDVLFWYYVGLCIVLSMMGRDGGSLEAIDVVVCILYPVMYTIFIPYCIIRDVYEEW